MSISIKTTIFAFAVAAISAVAVVATPAPAYAFGIGNIIDPLCLFACDKPELPPLPGFSNGSSRQPAVAPITVNKNTTYVNSNVKSPGATVSNSSATVGATSRGSYQPQYPTYQPQPQTPIYNYNYNPTPVYYQQTSPLAVSCYPMPLNAQAGDNVTWVASAYGGNGSYNYTWTGTDGLSGYGSAVSKVYYNGGYKSASVTVVSGGQTISRNCDGSINVSGGSSYYYPNYYQPTYYQPTYYSQLAVSCSANTANNYNGSVTWSAYATGGNGGYTYSWSGTDGLTGYGQSVPFTYYNSGYKTATVTVYSNGQSVTQSCSANVGSSYNGYQQTYYQTAVNSNVGLDIGCYVDPASPRINQPVTWNAEVTGGVGPYKYSWTGTDDLSGTQASVIKYYSTTGSKSAVVTVTSADGRTGTRACTTAASVRAAAATGGSSVQTQASQKQNDNSQLTGAALLSLQNVPWGWVAILVILVLIATVMYLIFNKSKI